jgi:glycosyltransferase involved in cell wall biosynthesis
VPEVLLSAAMIVRNEARHLDECLASLEGIADEVVVVDTGSTDDTKAIADRRGVRVSDFSWCDDFAAARNRAIDLALGRWILYIDADERARCADRDSLRKSLNDGRLVGLYVQFHVHPAYTPYPELRLFRNDPRIRFEGVIHETIWPSVHEQTRAGNGQIGESGLELLHVGYVGDLSHKAVRNLPLLERAVQVDPERVYLWCELGKTYDVLARPDDAARAFRKALSIVRRRERPALTDSVAYMDAIRWRFQRRLPVDRLIAEGLRYFPTNRQLLWNDACRLMERRNFRRALHVIERVLAPLRPEDTDMTVSYDRRIFGVFGMEAAATCHFKLGNYAEAAGYFARAVAEAPDNAELRGRARMVERLVPGAGATPRREPA